VPSARNLDAEVLARLVEIDANIPEVVVLRLRIRGDPVAVPAGLMLWRNSRPDCPKTRPLPMGP
jgi:hypothetical protein